MNERLKKLRWDFYHHQVAKKYPQYYQQGKINFYDDELIAQLRDVYFLGIPASIILLSRKLCDGHCHQRARLLAKALLNTNDDVRMVTADINNLKLNPAYQPHEAEHCFVERTTADGKVWIYDTSDGFVFDKQCYWQIEKPQIHRIINKSELAQDFVDFDYLYQPDNDPQFNRIAVPAIKQSLALGKTAGDYCCVLEPYVAMGKLQRELKLFKDKQQQAELTKN